MHLTPELCQLFFAGEVSAEVFLRAAVSHLVEECPDCRHFWEEFNTSNLAPSAGEELISEQIARQASRLTELRAQRQAARRDLRELLGLESEARRRRIENARTRFRSQPFVEELLEESRRCMRRDAKTAAELASLVPVAIHWMAGSVDPKWATRIGILALAAEGKALRLGGDMAAAERCFQEIGRRLARYPVLATSDLAEVKMAEAMLRFEQRRYDDVESLVDTAILHHRVAGNTQGLAQAWLLKGQVHSAQSSFLEARRCYAEAATFLNPKEDQYLMEVAVASEVNALCGMGEFDAASRLLRGHLARIDEKDMYPRAVFRGLEGQVAMSQQRWTEAEAAYVDCRDGCLAVGRNHDAALACLEIATAMLHQGRLAEVTQMAGDVLKIFRAKGAEQEALSALILIQEAAASQSLTLAILRQTRKRLEASQG